MMSSNEAFPAWATLVVVILAVLLVRSMADTLFNAIASIVTADIPRLLGDPSQETLSRAARLLTLVVTIAAVFVGAQGYSVLTLFLLADLLAASSFIPFLHGLYSPHATEWGALIASLVGLVVGLAYFPTLRSIIATTPVVGGLLPAPSFLWSFLGATVVSGVLTMVFARVTDTQFDLDSLVHEIRTLEEPATDGGDRPSGGDREV